MIEKNISFQEYRDMVKRIVRFVKDRGICPKYADVSCVRVFEPEYMDAIYRVLTFREKNHRDPKTVLVRGDPLKKKSNLWLNLEKALKCTFNSPLQLSNCLKKHPDYEYYYDDKKTQSQTLKALEKIGPPGVNCVDISQVIRQVLIDMGIPNVHIWRGKFKCGGHIWVTFGFDNQIFDAAGMMKYGYPIGRYMCSGYPTELSCDPAWLVSDDGIT